jgi:hypothetical protein
MKERTDAPNPIAHAWRALLAPLRRLTRTVGASSGAPVARPGQSVDAGVSDLSMVPRSAEQRPKD